MKNYLFYFFLLLIMPAMQSQSIDIIDVKEVDFKSFGALYDTNDSLVSFYHYYKTTKKVEKAEIRSFEGQIQFFDEDFNIINSTAIVANRKYIFFKAVSNKTHVTFSFLNKENGSFMNKVFNAQGEMLFEESSKQVKNYNIEWAKINEGIGYINLLFPIINCGFLETESINNKSQKVSYFSNDNAINWTYTPKLEKKRYLLRPLYGDKNYIVIVASIYGSNFDHQPGVRVIVLNTKTGEELLVDDYDYEVVPKLITHALIKNENELLLFGEYFKKGHRDTNNAYNEGYYSDVYNLTTKEKKTQVIGWANSTKLQQALNIKPEDSRKEAGVIFFHDLVLANDGNIYAIGERVTRTFQGITTIGMYMSYGRYNNDWAAKYDLGNLIILKFKDNMSLNDIEVIEKSTSPSGMNGLQKSPLYNVRTLTYYLGSDYKALHFNKSNKLSKFSFIDRKYDKDREAFDITLKSTVLTNEFNLETTTLGTYKSNGIDWFHTYTTKNGKNILMTYSLEQKKIRYEHLK